MSFHGVPLSIISYRGPQLTSTFLKALQSGLDNKVKLNTAFHPQTDGLADKIIQTIEDMLRACVIDFKANLDYHLPFVEFSYNNSYHSNIIMVAFQALYERRC